MALAAPWMMWPPEYAAPVLCAMAVSYTHLDVYKRQLLYHDTAKRPQQNRTHCGFAWFNVLKLMRESASARAKHAHGRDSGGFKVIIP